MHAWIERGIEKIIRSAAGRPIRVGDRLRQLPFQVEWEVVARFTDHDGIPHARLLSIQDRRTTKVLACTALLNRRRFRPS